MFTHNTVSLTDRLDFTLGLRYVDETKDGSYRQLAAVSPACTAANAAAGGLGALAPLVVGLTCFPFAVAADNPATPGGPRTFARTFADNELIYTANVAYDLTDDVNAYLSFTHGFKSGGFNLDATAAAAGADPRFRSEIVDAWELGLKSVLFDGRVRANFAVFQQDITDFQVLEFTGIQFQTFNVDAVEVTGAEAEIEALLTDGLTGSLAVTYSDARYADDCAGSSTAPQVLALCGQKLTNAPEWVAITGLNYEQDLGTNLRWFVNGSVRWEDDRRTSTQALIVGTPFRATDDIQEANTKVNLRFGLGAQDEAWTLEVWGVNITDEQTKNVTFNVPLRGGSYLIGQPGIDATNAIARGVFIDEPATYGVTLRARF